MFTSLDGSRWTEAPVPLDGVTASSRNAAADISGCAVAGGSSTGNGFITFDATVGDEGAYAESFGSAPCGVAPPAGGTCPTQLRVGIAQLIATHGCFAAGRSGTYSTSKPVELNGLTLTPVHGAIVIDTANHTIGAGSSPVTVSVASVVLGSQPIDWLVPATSGPMRDLRNHGRPASVAPSTRRSTMLGYAFGGVVIPVLGSGGAARIPVNVKMPSPIGGFIGPAPTDDVTIHAGNAILGGASLSPGSLQIKIPVVSLGIAELAPFELDFDADPEVFDGRFGLVLPVVDTAIVSHFRFQQGHFVEGDAAADFRNSLPLYPDVFLQKVNLQVAGKRGNPCASPASNSNGPTSIGGGVTLAIGPQIGGTSLMDVDGEAAYAFPEASCHQPGLFTITGTGSVLGTKVGNAHASFATNGDINLGASVSVGGECLSATVGFDSAISPTPPISFYAEAHARINVLCASFPGTTVYISTHGIRACVLKGTFTYHWGSLLPSFGFGDCGAGDFASAASRNGRRVQHSKHGHHRASSRRPRGRPASRLRRGPTGDTHRTGRPAGHRLGSAPRPTGGITSSRAADISVDGSENSTLISLIHPQAGRWRIKPLPGSPAIGGVQTAHALPPIAVHAEVHGHQGVELLRYRSQPAPGRTVTFFETGGGLPLHRLGAITRAHGTLRFRPQHGATRHRLIVAEISERGFTVGAPRRLANFSAPPEPRLTRPRAITVRRRGSTIVISWRRVASASRYAVRALLTDGRQLLWLTRARTIRLPHVPGFDAGHVLVAALDSSNHPGPVATTRLRAVQVTCQRPRAVRGRLVCAARRKRRKPRQPHRKHR